MSDDGGQRRPVGGRCVRCGAWVPTGLTPARLRCTACGSLVLRERAGGRGDEQRIDQLREQLLADLASGHALEELEPWIEQVTGLEDDERAALWLYGWANVDR